MSYVLKIPPFLLSKNVVDSIVIKNIDMIIETRAHIKPAIKKNPPLSILVGGLTLDWYLLEDRWKDQFPYQLSGGNFILAGFLFIMPQMSCIHCRFFFLSLGGTLKNWLAVISICHYRKLFVGFLNFWKFVQTLFVEFFFSRIEKDCGQWDPQRKFRWI